MKKAEAGGHVLHGVTLDAKEPEDEGKKAAQVQVQVQIQVQGPLHAQRQMGPEEWSQNGARMEPEWRGNRRFRQGLPRLN